MVEAKRRVLLLITSLDRGGAQHHVRDLLAARPGECEFVLAGGGDGWLAREAARLGIAVHSLYLPSDTHSITDLRAKGQIRTLFAGLKPDLVHVHSTKAAFFGRLAARDLGIPVVYTVHGWPFQTGFHGRSGPVLSLLAEYLLRDVANQVIFVSRQDALIARRLRLVPPERVTVIENGIDVSTYPWHTGPYARRLIYVGRLERGKGVDSLLRVLSDLQQYSWELTICGEGSLRPMLEGMTRRSWIAGRVRFIGWVDDPLPAIASADCLVLPSEKEGLPYAALEALACGLSLIVTAVGALADLDLRQVMHIPSRNGEALREALRGFFTEGCTDPARLPRHEEVMSLFSTRFNLTRMTKDTAIVYNSILNPPGREPDRFGVVTVP